MNPRIVIRPEAEADIAAASNWFEKQSSGLGEEFLAEIELSFGKIEAYPQRYPRLRRRPDVRRLLMNRFPYRIFFIVRPDLIIVFRVLHSARHDREWKGEMTND